jgi:mRNA interferase MazF
MAHLHSLARSCGWLRTGWNAPSIGNLNQLLPVVNVVPLTSRKSPARRIYPNEVLITAGTAGLSVDSIALCYQIRTLDKWRLRQDLGELTESDLRNRIFSAIRFQLDM